MADQRPQRQGRYQPANIQAAPDNDVINYTPGGSKITIGVFPRFSSVFPDVPKIEIPIRSGGSAPKQLPLTRAGMVMKELNNEIFCVFCIGLDGGFLEPEKGLPIVQYQAAGIVTKQSGEVVKIIVGDGSDLMGDLAQFAAFALQKYEFDLNAKPIEQRSLATKVNQVNEFTLTHTWVATVLVPGGGEYRKEGNVKELRDAGAVLNSSFSFWKKAWTWAQGDRLAMIAEDFKGDFHTAIFTNKGQSLSTSVTPGLQSAILSASNQLRA